MSKFLYKYNQKVQPGDIDQLNHVNNVVYVQWIQDAAVKHWNSAISAEIREKYVWVILRHEIDYKNPAKLGDLLTIETKVLEAKGITSVRSVKIYREKDQKLLVQSITKWCMLHADTLRPARITEGIKNIFLAGSSHDNPSN
ncbi:MAG: acyl-CoA thioesterase [Bacteroidota bacterium]